MFKWFFRVAAIVFLFTAIVGGTAYFYPEKFLCIDSGPVKADVLIVLGGGLHERPQRTLQLFKHHAAPRIIVTGAGDDWINKHILLEGGVPNDDIEVEGDSKTTRENAKFTIKRLREEHVQSAILVTTWYHSRRALKTFEHYAPDIRFYSRPSYFAFARKDWPHHGNARRMWMEFLKLPGYWVCYGVNPF